MFTIDALLAMLFAVSLLVAIAAVARTSTHSLAYAYSLQQYAEDVASVLEATGVLDQAGNVDDTTLSSRMQLVLNQSMPPHAFARAKVTLYSYTPSGTCTSSCVLDGVTPIDAWCRCKTFSVSAGNKSTSDARIVSAATRRFVSHASDGPLVGMAVIEVFG